MFSSSTSAIVNDIKMLMHDGSSAILTMHTDEHSFNRYTTDWTGKFKGEQVIAVSLPYLLAFPASLIPFHNF